TRALLTLVSSGRDGGRRGGHEGLELATDIGSAGLEDELGHALVSERAEPPADLVGGPGHRRLIEHRVTARIPRGLVGRIEPDAVLLVHGEVALLGRGALDDRLPRRAARQLLGPPTELVCPVVGEREPGSAGRAHAL